jgi:hypothetical protein
VSFPKYHTSYDKFVEDTKKTAEKNGVTIRISQQFLVYTHPEDKVGSAGYFSDELKELAISTYDTKRWMMLFVHESCHMDQWTEKRKFWNTSTSGITTYFEYLNKNVELSERDVIKYTQIAINLELDCEKRSIKKIQKYKLPIDIKEYKKRANTYLYGYLYCAGKRQWYNRLYHSYHVWSLSPDRFQAKYTGMGENRGGDMVLNT